MYQAGGEDPPPIRPSVRPAGVEAHPTQLEAKPHLLMQREISNKNLTLARTQLLTNALCIRSKKSLSRQRLCIAQTVAATAAKDSMTLE